MCDRVTVAAAEAEIRRLDVVKSQRGKDILVIEDGFTFRKKEEKPLIRKVYWIYTKNDDPTIKCSKKVHTVWGTAPPVLADERNDHNHPVEEGDIDVRRCRNR